MDTNYYNWENIFPLYYKKVFRKQLEKKNENNIFIHTYINVEMFISDIYNVSNNMRIICIIKQVNKK